MDKALRENHADYRKLRSCIPDHITTLRIILEQSEEWNSPLIMNVVEYKKAFDSVDRNTLWKLMRH